LELRVVRRPRFDEEQQLHCGLSRAVVVGEPDREHIDGIGRGSRRQAVRLVQSGHESGRKLWMTDQELHRLPAASITEGLLPRMNPIE